MQFLDLKYISEQTMELVNPMTPEKVVRAGSLLDLRPGQRVIDFGSGFGEVLALWAQAYGIGGVGIDLRPKACERATRKIAALGLSGRIKIVCGDAAVYPFDPGAYDVAACIGATFIFGSYRQSLAALRRAIRPDGRLILGQPYWRTSLVPPDLARNEPLFMPEAEIFRQTREEGLEVFGLIRSTEEDWDRYESDNWRGLLLWLRQNPDHPDRQQVLDHLHESQDEYATIGREYIGWALYLLAPQSR